MARLRPCTWAALLLFAQFCVAALAKKGDPFAPGLVTSKPGWERVLLQTDGSAELVERYFLHWEKNVSMSAVEYFQVSSHADCLNVSRSMENVFATKTSHGTNVTSTLTFDNMVGVANYTLGVRYKTTKKVIYSKTLQYTIVGMVLYHKNEDGSKTVLNAEGSSGFKISYQDAMDTVVKKQNVIYCFIQYADGTSTDSLAKNAKKVPKGTTLLSSAPVVRHQFHHSSSLCDADAIGSYSPSTGIVLPKGCGFGFYWDTTGELCFGFNFEAYRSGKARLHFAWSGLTYSTGDLGEEIYECNMNVEVVGTPPVAVTRVQPTNHLFRYEGGETLTCTFFNADIHSVTKYRYEIGQSKFCSMVPGSLKPMDNTDYTQTAVFVVEPGRGGPHKTTLQYAESNATTSTTSTFKDAVMLTKFPLTYDERMLSISKMSPISGNENGGIKVTLSGYFASFQPDRDSIEFSGMKVPKKYIKSSSSDTIVFELPPKSIIGHAYEYEVAVHVGNGVSNKVRFFYRMRGGIGRISQSGTSYLRDNTYRVGDCTLLRFTVLVEPMTTKQIKGFKWILMPANGTKTDLFTTVDSLKDVDTSKPTVEIHPNQLGPIGNFILTGIIYMEGETVKKELALQRDNVPSIGAFILQPPKRYASYPRSPLRLIAIVNPPGNCYTGGHGMTFEWSVYGAKYKFSSATVRQVVSRGYVGIQVSRLGRELIIPQQELKPGNHKVTFRAWMTNQPEVFGVAETTIHVMKANIVPVIRHGESEIQANWATNLNIFATKSYDPDAKGENRTIGISYRWACNQSLSNAFLDDATKPCAPAILPESAITQQSFTIKKEQLKHVGDYAFLRFFLSVSKEGDMQNTTMDCNVLRGGTRPMLDTYSINLEDSEGREIPANDVPTYEDIVIRPSAVNATAWTYELLEPAIPDFKFYDMLLQGDPFFSPQGNNGNIFGSKKPLGFGANQLSSYTKYKVRVTFAGSRTHAATSIVVEFKTDETPKLGILNPVPREGTTTTKFTATAGLPMEDDRFVYYFHVTDLEGNRICVGGCTGYNIVHFSIMRPGTYSLSVSLYDKRGRSLLDQKVMPTPIVISTSGQEKKFKTMLGNYFLDGDDASWTQLANDMCIAALEENPDKYEAHVLLGEAGLPSGGKVKKEPESQNALFPSPNLAPEAIAGESRQEQQNAGDQPRASPNAIVAPPARAPETVEDRLRQARQDVVDAVAKGTRGITCSSTPNSKHGRAAILLLTRLLSVPHLGRATLFDCLYVLLCAVENAAATSAIDAEAELPKVIAQFFAHAHKIDAAGFARERALARPPRPGNVVADIAVVTGRVMARAVAAGKLDGFRYAARFGRDGEYGHIALFAGTAAEQMAEATVNGERRRVVRGRSSDELFYIMPPRFGAVFTRRPGDKRYIALLTVPNFVVRSRLQDAPSGTNLADDLYWVQMYAPAADGGGRLREVRPSSKQPAFCMRMPVTHNREFFAGPMSVMPGMYACGDIKRVGEEAQGKGEYFNYVYQGMRVVEYNVSADQNWVEACHTGPSLFGATAVSRAGGSQAVGLEKAVLLGQQGSLLAVLITGGLLLVVVIIAAAWLIAMRSSEEPPGAAPGGYVERDGYGRDGHTAEAAEGDAVSGAG